ncbi:MAG: sigma-E factor negative regulatory protein [Undibacterium sp.]|nr:sigma-E factor negative regulatory protein [Undibacterium sp.]
MNVKINQHEDLSSMADGELTDAQMDALLGNLKHGESGALRTSWDLYHQIGDILRSDDLDVPLSHQFSQKISARLAQEPSILAPQAKTKATRSYAPYAAITSLAAMLMVAFVMAPQIIPLLQGGNGAAAQVASNEAKESFAAAKVTLASNHEEARAYANTNHNAQEAEFAPKLENQVEMLRDARLDSYLQAHQKVSPALDNSGRYIQRANIVSNTETEK